MNLDFIKNKLLIKYPEFANTIINSQFIDSFIDTAGTDGKNIYYNSSFLDSLTEGEQLFVFAHEICHIAFHHIERKNNRNQTVWNIATDAIINAYLKRDGFSIIKSAVQIEDACFYSAEEMYQILLEKKNYNKYKSHDNHTLWKYELGYSVDEVRELEDSSPITNNIDWRRLLKENITHRLDWSVKDAFLEDGIVVYPMIETFFSSSEILLDTSSSVNSKMLKNFLLECRNILSYSKIKVGCFDTKFYGFTDIISDNDINQLIIHGGGGTNYELAVSSFTNQADNKILFTDGLSPMPKKALDVIWVVYGDKKIHPLGGKVITVNPQELINKVKVRK